MIVSKLGVAILHNEKFHNSYSSPRIIRMLIGWNMNWAASITHMRKNRNVYKVLVTKASRKIPFFTPGQRWKRNIKMELQ
jgi:hypothetical protein